MSNEITSPLADIVRKAMESKTTGKVQDLREAEQKRLAIAAKRMKGAGKDVLIVADLSGSMGESIGGLNVTKHRHLEVALEDVRKTHPAAKVIIFNSSAMLFTGSKLPSPDGGTNLAFALQLAQTFKPQKTIIISDGLPDDGVSAKREADKITGVVDTIYCGPDGHPAIEFLRSLSHATGGVSIEWDGRLDALGNARGTNSLASNIRGLLTA
jgi:hypothetical protein